MADDHPSSVPASAGPTEQPAHTIDPEFLRGLREMAETCLLYTSDAADE